jgi:hypothetical protein
MKQRVAEKVLIAERPGRQRIYGVEPIGTRARASQAFLVYNGWKHA